MSDPNPVDSSLSGHVVVCGADHLAIRIVQELQLRGEQVVLLVPVEVDPHELDLNDVRVICGDQVLPRVLRTAGVERAAAVVLSGDDDLANLNAALAAHELNHQARLIVRMFDTGLGTHLAGLFPHAVFLSSSALAAPGFVSAAVFGDGGERFSLGGRILVARSPTDPPAHADAPERSIPIAIVNADRTVEVLPDAAAAGRGHPMVVDVFDPAHVRPPVVAARQTPRQPR